MAAFSEKFIWPIVGIFIFGVLAGFYIDDRRRMLQENTGAATNQQASNSSSSSEHAGKTADSKKTSSEHAGKAAQNNPTKSSSKQASSHSATSMSMDEYLAHSTSQRSQELEANVTHHQGFSGSIDEYLSGAKPKSTKKMQASASTSSASHQNTGATSMSMEEYQAKTNSTSHKQSSNNDAYHGDLDGYLAKFSNGTQTPMKKKSTKPFNKKEHMGFHGSYEEYAKKYN